MVVEVKSQPMTDFVFLKEIEVESQHPNVKNKNTDSSPNWKVSSENRVIFDVQIFVLNDEYKDAQHD